MDLRTTIAQSHMRRLETERLVLYYPRGSKAEALRVAARLESCRRELEQLTQIKGGWAATKTTFVLPQLNYDNAFIAPGMMGSEQIGMLPQHNSQAYFLLFAIPPDPSAIGCHEMVHDVVARQIRGPAAWLRYGLGRASWVPPSVGFEPWFQEGVAVYYETKLGTRGRLWSPYYEGFFSAMMAGRSLDGGMLRPEYRKVPFGGHYVIGSRFIDYLNRTYGEDKLWSLISIHAGTLTAPLGVSSDFKTAYGKSLSDLLDDFEADVHKRYPVRPRPEGQSAGRGLGLTATLAATLPPIQAGASPASHRVMTFLSRSACTTAQAMS